MAKFAHLMTHAEAVEVARRLAHVGEPSMRSADLRGPEARVILEAWREMTA
jgi:hypothetical protein